MATISNTLALNDAMSPAIRSIAASLSSLTASFEELARISGRSIDTGNINAGTRAINQAEDAQDDLTESMRETESAADGLWGKVKGFIAAYAGWELVRSTVAWSDEMTMLQARLNNINDGTRTNIELMAEVYKTAQNSRISLEATANIVSRIGNNAREAFSSNNELLAFAEQIQKQFTLSGAGVQEAEYALIQLSQGLASGVLRGEELNSVFEQAPTIIRSIADYLNVPIGQIRAMAAEGKITADIVKNAMFASAEETNKQFEKIPLTFSAAWTMAKNTFQMNMLGLQKILSDTFNTAQFQQLMDSLTNAVTTFASVAIPIIKGVIAVVGFMHKNWDMLAPVIFSVVGALVAYKAVMLAQAAATKIATVAQWALNGAMLANPVGLVVAAIASLIGLLYLTIAVINRITGESYSATAIIAGTLYGLWAHIKNIFTAIWNGVLSVAEFFMNVWTNPVYSVKKLIFSLLDTFKGLYMGILRGLDPVLTAVSNGFTGMINGIIKGVNWLSSALDEIGLGWGQTAEFAYTTSFADDAEKTLDGLLAGLDPGVAPGDYKSLDHLKADFVDPRAYTEAGYQAGAKFSEDPMGAIKKAMGLGEDPAIQKIMDDVGKSTAATQQIAKNTAPNEQNYQYVKDIMAGRAVDRLSGTDIRIQMNNNNKINSALDLDAIVNALAQKLTGAMDSAAEGVHR